MWMIKNFVGGLTWICRDKQEHEKINVEIEFKWDAVCYHCQNENLRIVKMATYTDSSSAYSSSDMVQKLWRGEWLSRHWGDEESVLLLAPGSCILHYCHLSTSASTQPHLARPGRKQPLIHLHPGGNMMTRTLPFLLIYNVDKYVDIQELAQDSNRESLVINWL